ncbi:RNase adapter protein RapZ [Vibrio stylophorae]|uniref:RNase adapter protein RapZ n=1 Tax=Vibrio stylophorae TaxID=659351 RepID=A0ABN8DMZ3_9VIBR|nr:RNase adapter RapZ [Vibrio stylophorae]CAH0532494.1 RNase adapter protein RapZ [Vibrio stylophorae]
MPTNSATQLLTIVSGRSGSGKSVALRVLEDLGHYCVDNIPLSLLPSLATNLQSTARPVAISLDVRNLPSDPEELTQTLALLPQDYQTNILFIDADDKVIIKRYSETRRLHPLSHQQMSLEQAIEAERSRLAPMKEMADLVIDSSQLSIHDLSETVRSRMLGREARELVMVFESFGFKHGLPSDADYVFDVRFLPNPHWEPALKPLTGLDQPVIEFFQGQSSVSQFVYQTRHFLEMWLPMLEKNNRSYLTVAVGCTGGQHRSVYVAEQLANYFKQHGHQVQTRHRTLERLP